MRHALRAKVRTDREAGFTLIEILVAMVLMAIIMSSLAVFFIGAQKSSSALRIRQSATVLADDVMDKVHSVAVPKLLTGRDKYSSDAQWAAPVVGVDLSTMTELWDTTSSPLPANNAGTDPTTTQVPTGVQTQDANGVAYKYNSTPFSVSTYVGRCYIPEGGGSCVKTAPTSPVPMDRVIVAVNWTSKDASCPAHTCSYVIGSLISPTGDPTFNVNQVILDTTPPTTPSSVTCSTPNIAGAGDIKVNSIGWSTATDSSGIGRYDIYHGTSADFSTMSKIGTSSTVSSSFVDTGLTPSTTYYYVVIAVDAVGNASAPQVPNGTVTVPQQPFMASCTTLPDTVKPVSPVSISGTATTNTVALTWPAGTDDYQVAGYQIFRGSTLIATVAAPTLTFTDTGLSPWTSYTYQVKAVDVAGNVSTTTNPTTTVVTKDTVAPTKPLSLNAVAKPWPALEIDLDWTDSTDDVAVTGYTVYRATAAGGPWTSVGTPTTSSFADTSGLVTNKQYWYYVTAHDAVPNTSAASGTATATTPDTQAPSVPTGLTSPTKTAFSVSLSWTAATDNIGIAGYKVYRDGTLVGTTTGTGTAFTDTTADDLTTYVYTVAAYDAAGNASAQSTGLSVKTLDGTPPTTTTLSSTGQTVTSITLSWGTSTDNLAVTGYALYEDGGTTPIATLSAATHTYTDPGEAASSTHTYTVKAFDAAGNYSAASNTVSATTLADTVKPAQVANLKGTSSSKSTATITWNASSDNVAVAGYYVYSGGTLVSTLSASTLSQTYTGLGNNTTYNITVAAFDAAGNVSPISATLKCVVSSTGSVTCT